MPYAEVASKTLVFAVYDFDRFSKHDQIGQIQLALNSVDMGQTLEEWRDLASPETDAEKVDNSFSLQKLAHAIYRKFLSCKN